jgi:hypothetical protein
MGRKQDQQPENETDMEQMREIDHMLLGIACRLGIAT